MDQQSKFEGFAIVECFGHTREVGHVTTEFFGGPALFRIDQPPRPEREIELTKAQWIGDVLAQPGTKIMREALPGKTVYVGPSAIFRLTPCSEETAMRAIEELIPSPIKILHLVERKKLEAVLAGLDADSEPDDNDPDDDLPY